MNTRKIVRAAAAIALAIGCVVCISLKPGPGRVTAEAPPPDAIRLIGVVRDFHRTHPDFNVVPSAGFGHYAGCVGTHLNSTGQPLFVGGLIDTRTITDFTITQGNVTSTGPFAAMVTLLGAAIENSTYHLPVTMKMSIGAANFEVFGSFDNAVAGNVNDNQSATGNDNPGSNPRRYVFPNVFPGNSAITITGRSWTKSGGSGLHAADWHANLTADSHTQTQQVRVLRNGDPVPNIAGFNNQTSIAGYVSDFVDSATHTIKLLNNQAIYLFEVGTTSLTSTAADFQDLVVLVTLARDPAYLETLDVFGHETAQSQMSGSGYKVRTEWMDRSGHPIAPNLYHNPASGIISDSCGQLLQDVAGAKGATSTGGITSAASFDQWFRDELGVNLSSAHAITLTRGSDGVYEYSTRDFHPIDGKLFNNESESHNYHFTYVISANFVYQKCGKQFFEFAGADDSWVFVNGDLVMDRGGVLPNVSQYVDMDRLGLVNGQTYTLQFYFAQRQTFQAEFHIRTNIFMHSDANYSVSGGYD